jgi:dihydroorotate dehydrogenase
LPDWTYHPFFKPLLFRLRAELGRRLTLWLLSVQGRTAVGRAVFRLFGHVHPPREVAVEAFGRRFPSPIGLGAGIDTDATALSVMQYLGFGFLEVGPARARATAHRYATEPRRIAELHAIVRSDEAAAPAASELAAIVGRAPALGVPVGVAVRGSGDALLRATRDAGTAAFVTLPPGAEAGDLRALRSATSAPLLLTIAPDATDDEVHRAAERAVEADLDGFVVGGGTACDLLPSGRMHGPGSRRRALAIVRDLGQRSALPVIDAAGAASPEDAVDALEAGATLVALYEGLVYAGPGLPGRMVRALADWHRRGRRPQADGTVETAPGRVPRWAWMCICFTGLVLIASGLFALYLAATDHMLPPDVAYLGMTSEELCRFHGCRIVEFMVHDRVSFGGSILTVGLLYGWLGAAPLRAGEPWAWWTLVVSGALGFGSFLTYIGYGYLDAWHGIATLLLLPWFVAGMAASFRGLQRPRGVGALRRRAAPPWIWSPAGMGRAFLAFSAFGMVAGGLTIMVVGMTQVFVPQDLSYMGLTVDELRAVSPKLVPLIAHDRAGFGGGLCSTGLVVAGCLRWGLRPASPGLWVTLLLSGLVGFGTAIGVHFVVGYVDFVHLLPAYAGAAAFLVAMAYLFRPMCRTDADARFPDV